MKSHDLRQGAMGDLSPHTLALLTLLQEYCRGLVALEQPPEDEESRCDEEWPPATRHAIALLLVREIQAGGNDTYTHTLQPLYDDITAIDDDGPEIASLLRETLLQIESPEEVFRLTDALRVLISPSAGSDTPALEPNSLFGVFVRRSLLQFFQMDFFQVSRLYRRMTQVYNRLGAVDGCDDITERRVRDVVPGSLAPPSRDSEALRPSPSPRPRSAGTAHAPTDPVRRHRHHRVSPRDRIPLHLLTSSVTSSDAKGRPLTRLPSAVLHMVQDQAPGIVPAHEGGRLLKEVEDMRAEGLTADEIKHGLRYPLERITHLPVAHYVRYACCMQSGDASGALANLHRYFDLQAKYSAWKPPTDKVTHAAGEPVAQQVKKPPVHYAALSLAATHHRFGNIPEATHAVLEAIKFAQDSADDAFLQHALGWLALLNSDTVLHTSPAARSTAADTAAALGSQRGASVPNSATTLGGNVAGTAASVGGSAGELTRLFVAATRHHENPEGMYLQGLAKLAHAKQQFSTGQPPAEVLALVRDGYTTAVLNATQTSALAASFDTLTGMCFLLHAALFDAYGHAPLALLYAQLHLRNRSPGMPDDGCEAYCKLALHSVAEGNVDLANRFLEEAEYLFPKGTPTARIWELAKENIEFHQALLKENVDTAQSIARRIKGAFEDLGTSGEDNDFRQALIHIEHGAHSTSVVCLERVIARMKPQLTPLGEDRRTMPATGSTSQSRSASDDGMVPTHVTDSLATHAHQSRSSGESNPVPVVNCKYAHVLCVMAECHLAGGDAARALVVAREAQAHARTHRLAYLHANAARIIAGALSALGRPHEALQILHRVLPQLLGHGSKEARGKTHYTCAVVRLSLLTSGGFYPHTRARSLTAASLSPESTRKVVKALQRAVDIFADIGARRLTRESLFVLACVHHACGSVGARDAVARRLITVHTRR